MNETDTELCRYLVLQIAEHIVHIDRDGLPNSLDHVMKIDATNRALYAVLMGGEAFVTVGRFDCGHWEHAHGRFRDDQTVYAWTKLRKAPPLPAPPSGQGEVK